MIKLTSNLQEDWKVHCPQLIVQGLGDGLLWLLAPTAGTAGINSSEKAFSVFADPQYYEELKQETLHQTPAVTRVFALYNGEKFSPWAEVGYQARQFSGDIGANLGYAKGIAVKLPEGLVMDRGLKSALDFLEVRGEVLAEIDQQGTVVNFQLGHSQGIFQLYSHLIWKDRISSCLRFLSGDAGEISLKENFSMNTLVTPIGFPFSPVSDFNIPTEFRMNAFKLGPGCLFVSSGESVKRTRGRLKRILYSIGQEVQYRNDYHFSEGLVKGMDIYRDNLNDS